MADVEVETIWNRLIKHEGELFHTISGVPFTYEIDGDEMVSSNTHWRIRKTGDVAVALSLAPFEGPGVVNELVFGPAYVWAVLHDKRIRLDDY